MTKRKKSKSKVFLSLLLCLLSVLSLMPVSASAAGNTVNLEVQDIIPYGTHATARMVIDGGDGIAYCVEPTKHTPSNGEHTYTLLGENSAIRKALYYLQGGPAYDVIKNTYLSGWDDNSGYVIAHLVVSYIHSGYSGGTAFYGATEEYIHKAIEITNVISGQPEPSADFQAFMIADEDDAQTLVGFWYQRYGWIELNKTSADPSVTDGNDCYFLEGARYGIYSGDTLVATLTTDQNGYARSGQLETGNYVVKELSASLGYRIDIQGYNATVTADQETKIDVKEQPATGWIELHKTSADSLITDQNANYSLENAEYQLYKGDKLVTTLITDADGYAKAENLPLGDYTLQESTPSQGYKLDVEVHGIAVHADEAAEVSVTEIPESGWIELKKTSANVNISDGNSNYSLKDAKYGVFMGDRQVTTLITDENGYAKSEAIGIGEYVIRELSPSPSYALDVESYNVTVTDTQLAAVNVTEVPQNYAVDLLVQKIDSETKKDAAQGAATLKDAEFTVKYYETVSDKDPAADGQEATRTWVFKTDGNGKIRFNEEYLLSGDTFYTDMEGNNCLPVGTVTIQETKAPVGYHADKEVFVIRLDGTGEVETIATVDICTAEEQVYRGDLEFVKVADGDLARLAHVPFTITSKTTGESHVIVTDENGYASTAASWVKHTQHTNEGKSSEDGIWFGTGEPDDTKGALLYDTYVVEEQRCEANKGMDLLKIEIKVHRDNVTVQMGTLIDDRIEIETTALDKKSGTHYAKPEKEVTIVDTVSYEGLKQGQEYKLVGKLVDQLTGEVLKDASGMEITSETTFMAKKRSGEATVSFVFNASALAGKTTVVFENLYHKELLLATHADLEDEDQTICFPEIRTTAINDKTKTHAALAEKDVTLTDTVFYKGLFAGRTYTLTGTLMDRATGKTMQDANGKNITAETTFITENTEGSAELHFVFDGSLLAGKTVVAFEYVKEGQKEVAVHADIRDTEQTIFFPQIHTMAKDKTDKDQTVSAIENVTIVDTVNYSNLTAGRKYQVSGILMDQATGKALIRADGKEITADIEFTAEKGEGSVEVTFVFDVSALGGHSVVVFEKLTDVEAKTVLAVHEDIHDKDQTVKVETPNTPTPPAPPKTVTSIPKTGDNTQPALWAAIALIAAGSLIVLIRLGRRKRNNDSSRKIRGKAGSN